jgi:hypothetical protein
MQRVAAIEYNYRQLYVIHIDTREELCNYITNVPLSQRQSCSVHPYYIERRCSVHNKFAVRHSAWSVTLAKVYLEKFIIERTRVHTKLTRKILSLQTS